VNDVLEKETEAKNMDTELQFIPRSPGHVGAAGKRILPH
jgi:hypothetical protein